MRAMVVAGAIAGVSAVAVAALRWGGMRAAVSESPRLGEEDLRAIDERIRIALESAHRDVVRRLEDLKSQVNRMSQESRIPRKVDQSITEVESLQHEMLTRMDHTMSEVESMEHEMLSRLDDLREQLAKRREQPRSDSAHGRRSGKTDGKSHGAEESPGSS